MTVNKKIKGFILTSLLLLMFASQGFPQSGLEKSGSIEVSATILPEIQIVTIRDIDLLGVEVQGNIMHVSPIMDVHAGMMLASGQPDAEIRIQYLKQLEMVRTDGPGQLVVTYEVSVYTEDNQRASRLLETIEEALRFNNIGNIYIWVGSVIDFSNAFPGNYEGEFTIEIEYI